MFQVKSQSRARKLTATYACPNVTKYQDCQIEFHVSTMRLTSNSYFHRVMTLELELSFQNPEFKILEGLNPECRNTESILNMHKS